ncbi:MAG: type IV pilus assembly protein PilM [Candidatus Pacebacteria bacterium]|nr:type IV pilus assembly protein PilM [Candidatus Paceibacterota bacterium]
MGFINFKKRAIGVDVSDLSIKFALIEKQGKKTRVVLLKKQDIAKGAIEKGEIKNEQLVAQAIQKAFQNLEKEKRGNFKKAVITLPEEKSFVDIIKLPLLKESEKLSSMVAFEAENVIPFPLSEVYYDFEKVETTAKLAKCQEVILSACPKETVDKYLDIFNEAGFFLLAMEVESFAIARAITEKDFFYSPFLIVDFGETRTTLAIFAGRNLRFTSTIQASSRQLTKSIATFFEISEEAAEEIKIKEGLNGKKEVYEAMIPFLNDVAEQIKHYIDYYRTHSIKCQEFDNKKSLKKIYLCGEGANLKGITEFLFSELGIEIEKADVLVNLSEKKLPQSLKSSEALGFATAIGAALRGVE